MGRLNKIEYKNFKKDYIVKMALINFFSERDLDFLGFQNDLFPKKNFAIMKMKAETPKCDVQETEDQFQIIAEFPGVKKEDISIKIDKGLLTLSSKVCNYEKKDEADDQGIVWHKRERYQGSYKRQFTLPENIVEDEVYATFENGILSVNIKKDQIENNGPRTITIQ